MFNFQEFMGLGGVATYSVQLRAFSAPFFQKYDEQKINELNHGGKILLPNSCLDNLIRRHIQWPMLFKLINVTGPQKATHAGVLEFLAEEGRCYLPSWIMNQLHLLEGDLITVEYKTLPSATYAKFKPMSTDFYLISNPRAMLEVELRKFACLTKGDVVAVQYNEQVFEFQVMDLRPENAVTIIECDINIEFDMADGYVEPNAQTHEKKTNDDPMEGEEAQPPTKAFVPFAGPGHRWDGKKPKTTSTSSSTSQDSPSTSAAAAALAVGKKPSSAASGGLGPIIADELYQPGCLHFVRVPYKNRAAREREAREKANSGGSGGGSGGGGVTPFAGKGNTIRASTTKK